MSESLQYPIEGDDAATVARSIEQGVVSGALEAGQPLPSVRGLARQLGLSPSTISAAYRDLRQRGVIVSHDRSRTTVSHRPPLAVRLVPELPDDAIDLATGNPDPGLLPDLGPALSRIGPVHRLYGDAPTVERLIAMATADFVGDGVDADHLAVVGGGLDGIERVLEIHCRMGDRVGVEDPCYIGTIDLVRTLGLIPVPFGVDDEGPLPGALADVLERGVSAVLTVPRAQNPTGAALTADRAETLRTLLADHPGPVIIEDDPAPWICGSPYHTLTRGRQRWAVVRSVAKSLGPDLRVATLAADTDTVTRLQGRQRLGTGWVSHLLQRLAAEIWVNARDDRTLATATATYGQRRRAVVDRLDGHDLVAHGTSGINVWVPVAEEVPVVQGMAARGWAIQAGEPFRIASPPGIRITVAALDEHDGERMADDLAEVLGHHLGTRRG